MPKIIQFAHPGREHGPDKRNGLLKSWNTAEHRRKFLQSEGDCVAKNGKLITNQELLFWGEWEPDSRVDHLPKKSDKFFPQFLHQPCLPAITPPIFGKATGCGSKNTHDKTCKAGCSGDEPAYQNTDPYVFGACFKYFSCGQIRNEKASAMSRLEIGSMILFGSYGQLDGEAYFQLDTVFVIGGFKDYHPAKPESLKRHPLISADFLKASFRPAFGSGSPDIRPDLKLRLYFSASFETPTENGMYSFVPAKIKGKTVEGFPRVRLKDLPYLTNGLKQGFRGTGSPDISASEVLRHWKTIREISRSRGCVEGVRFLSPPSCKHLGSEY